jgi:hypothetical protein
MHEVLAKTMPWRNLAVVIGDETGAASAIPKSVSRLGLPPCLSSISHTITDAAEAH